MAITEDGLGAEETTGTMSSRILVKDGELVPPGFVPGPYTRGAYTFVESPEGLRFRLRSPWGVEPRKRREVDHL